MAAKKAASSPSSRVSRSHGHARRTQDIEPASVQGPAPADGLGVLASTERLRTESLPRERRLRRSADIQALRKRGSSQPHRLLTLRVARNSLPYSRFGFVVGRRVAKSAVMRNRLRRRMREVVRRAGVRDGWDLLFIARPPAAAADFAGVRQAVLEVTRRADLLVEPEMGSSGDRK